VAAPVGKTGPAVAFAADAATAPKEAGTPRDRVGRGRL